jgi:hypothetical protein
MEILKKIGGICLMIAAVILSFVLLITCFKTVFDCIREINKNTSEGIGYTLGCLVMIVLIILLIRFMFKKSLKLIRTQPQTEDSIEDIGL